VSGLKLGGLSIRFSLWSEIGGKWRCVVYVGCKGDIELGISFKCGRGHWSIRVRWLGNVNGKRGELFTWAPRVILGWLLGLFGERVVGV